jgi:outer membrane immunogenic protein
MRKLSLTGVKMNRFAIVTALTFLGGTSAFAADMAVKAPPLAPPPTCLWCGWNIGINVGGSWDNDPATYTQPTNAGTATATLRPSGVIGGGQIGYNWQNGNIVYGLEGDIDGRRASGTANGLMPFLAAPTAQINLAQTDEWLATIRGRLGVSVGNNVLLYGTGGGAFGRVEHSYTQFVTTNPAATLALSDSTTRSGWTAGVGFDWMAWKNLSLGVEYLYVDLGHSTINQTTAIIAGGVTFFPTSGSFTNRSNIVRAKLDWHFTQ